MNVLVDSSSWIDYFRGVGDTALLDYLIEENLIVVNVLILAELLPPLHVRKNNALITLMKTIKRQPMHIYWEEVIHLQTVCLLHGINGVGIPDLLVAQNALQGNLFLLSRDKHFALIAPHMALKLYK